MASRYNLPHFDLSDRLTSRKYVAPSKDLSGNNVPRTREAHGVRLREQLQQAFQSFETAHPIDPRMGDAEGDRGTFLEVDLRPGTPAESIERKSLGLIPTAVNLEDNDDRRVGFFVPDAAQPFLDKILEDYTSGPLTAGGSPKRKDFVEPIEAIRAAKFQTFYTDRQSNLPEDRTSSVWWEVWCIRSAEPQLESLVDRVGGRMAEQDRRLYFPEVVLIPVLASQEDLEIVLFARFAITEIRRASDNPTVFLDVDRDEQIGWTDDLAGRVNWPGANAPAVCLIDTGVNRAHHLIEPALDEKDMVAVRSEWGVDDGVEGHGTSMAGIALHGDLTFPLAGDDVLELVHRLESVKVLPPTGFESTEERFYGAVTQSAIALPEIDRPERPRVYCMAVSNAGVSGFQPTGWSSAIDQAASGSMEGDEFRNRRLIVLSTGNVPNEIDRERVQDQDSYPIEDPAQAWNALTVGGYTDKVDVTDEGLDGYQPYSSAGELSPHSRTSSAWTGKPPFKPDIVMEAGNRAVSPSGRDVLDADSLAVLSTGPDTDRQPLVPFRATSAAAAAAGRLAARLMAEHPDYWPETVRALMIHAAEWTAPMKAEFNGLKGMTERAALIRRYGYGVPTFERANASANDHLALMMQSEIQPFASEGKAFEESHFYPLPWPRETLEKISDQQVELKITLSYFIEPNPGFSATIDPYRYQSFGLRFDLRRRNETAMAFSKRVNASFREKEEKVNNATDDDTWMFGRNSIAAGSVHSDVWSGPAARLLSRDLICVYPVGGWWRNRASKEIRSQKARYSLVVSLKSEINLYTPIQTLITSEVPLEVPF